jgi:sarcosine oxidase subunit alpha
MPEMTALKVNGTSVVVPEGSMISTALAAAGITAIRHSVRGEPRGPLCGMGICFECRVTVNDQAFCRSCQTLCQNGMDVRTEPSDGGWRMADGGLEKPDGGIGEEENGGMGEWENGGKGEDVSHSPTLPLSHSPTLPLSVSATVSIPYGIALSVGTLLFTGGLLIVARGS